MSYLIFHYLLHMFEMVETIFFMPSPFTPWLKWDVGYYHFVTAVKFDNTVIKQKIRPSRILCREERIVIGCRREVESNTPAPGSRRSWCDRSDCLPYPLCRRSLRRCICR